MMLLLFCCWPWRITRGCAFPEHPSARFDSTLGVAKNLDQDFLRMRKKG